jgi:hypothetical protein
MVSVKTTYDGSGFHFLPSFLPSLEYCTCYVMLYNITLVKIGGDLW